MALMDEGERQRFLDTLRHDEAFRAAVRRELDLEMLHDLPEQVVHLTNGVNGLVAHQAELQQSVATLVDGQHRLGTELTQLLGETLRVTTEGFAAIGGRLADSEAGFDRLETRFDTLDARFDTLDARVDQGFTAMSAHFDQLDAAIAELRGDQGP